MGGGIHSIDTFIDTKYQKALRREIDYFKQITDGEEPRWAASRNRWVFSEKGGKQDDEESSDGEQDEGPSSKRKSKVPTAIVGANPSPSKATKDSPVLLALYGQLSSCAKSYQSALCKWCQGSICIAGRRHKLQFIYIRHTTFNKTIPSSVSVWPLHRLPALCNANLTIATT